MNVIRGRVGGLAMLPPLSAAEERRLYPMIIAGREAAGRLATETDRVERSRLERQRRAGQDAESILLRATCGLVRARVVERGFRFGQDELEAAGVEGLAHALARFDPSRGYRFATYANYWITKMVLEAVREQLGVTDQAMRLASRVARLQRQHPDRELTVTDVADALGVDRDRASEVLHVAHDVWARRRGSVPLADVAADRTFTPDPPEWVIAALRESCGEDFEAFWSHTVAGAPIAELARARGLTRQGLAKRLARCRQRVLASGDAGRLVAWLDAQ